MMSMSRRKFLEWASRAGAAASLMSPWCSAGGQSQRATGAPSSIPIVDTHQHLWDLSKLTLTWLTPPLDRSFTLADYVEASRGLHVVKAVYMEVAVPPDQRRREAEYVIDLCRQPDSVTCAAVLAGSPTEDGFERWVGQFKDNPWIKGMRGRFSSVEQMSDARVIRNLHLLGELGMRFDVNVPPPYLAGAAQLVQQCPGTRFVLDHCGNADPVAFFEAARAVPRPARHSPEQWKRDIDTLAANENLICKISGIVANVPGYALTAGDLAGIINHCLNTFGPNRVVFASDWPVCLRGMSLRNWVNLLKDVVADRPEADQRKLFHDNAVAFYDLRAEPTGQPGAAPA